MRLLRRLLRAIALLLVVAIIGVAALIASIELGCRPPRTRAAALGAAPAFAVTLPGYKRDESSTFFTYPEWYIVYAAEDLGDYVSNGDDSGFDYFVAVAGFWRSVCSVKKVSAEPPTTDVRVMIYAIGVSFTVEYAVKGLYETTIGRLTEWWRGDAPTAEDRFAHQVEQDYAKFLYRLPWYQYPFWTRLKQFWADVPMHGPAQPRKWERRAALTLEYAVKAGYGALIQTTMDVTGEDDAPDIMFVVRDLNPDDLAAEPRLTRIADLGGGNTLVRSPRYQDFTEIALALSRAGRVIPEVAGNRTILMTVVAPPAAKIPPDLSETTAMPLAARPGFRRIGSVVQIDRLVDVVRELDRAKIPIEHLFDY
jgi:hypothetical protein